MTPHDCAHEWSGPETLTSAFDDHRTTIEHCHDCGAKRLTTEYLTHDEPSVSIVRPSPVLMCDCGQ